MAEGLDPNPSEKEMDRLHGLAIAEDFRRADEERERDEMTAARLAAEQQEAALQGATTPDVAVEQHSVTYDEALKERYPNLFPEPPDQPKP